MCAESDGRQIEHVRNGKILIYIVINFFYLFIACLCFDWHFDHRDAICNKILRARDIIHNNVMHVSS
jgi:hypothetical protein